MDETTRPPDVPGYALGERLGAGANGAVWAAIRGRDRAPVAIKVVDGDRPDEVRDGFGMDVVDDHLVRVHELVPMTHARTAVVMDLLPGGSLRSVVAARGQLSPGECVTVLAPLAGLLGRLHRRGIVHGDISPGNVLFDLRGRPHLTDLGAAHALGDQPQDVHGTDGFVAPEVLLGDDPGPAADVFGLAALGWFCLTGAEPDLAQVRGTFSDELERTNDSLRVPRELVEALDAGLVGASSARPDADAFAVAVFDSAEAEALQITKGSDSTSGLTRRLRSAVKGASEGGPSAARAGVGARAARHARSGEGSKGRSRAVAAALAVAFVALVGVALVLLLRPSATASAQPRPSAPATSQAADASAGEGTAASGPVGGSPAAPGGTTGPASAPPSASASPTPASAAATQSDTPNPTAALTQRTPGAEQLPALVQALSDLRSAAWGDVHSGPWGALTVPGSPAAMADAGDRDSLRATRTRAEDLSQQVRSAQWAGAAPDWAQHPTPTSVTVRATIDVSEHTVTSTSGERRVAAVTGAPPVTLELRWVDGTWRVWEVTG